LKFGDDAEGVVFGSGRGGGVYTNDGVLDSLSGLRTTYLRALPFLDGGATAEALDSPYVPIPPASSLILDFGDPGGVIITSRGPSASCFRMGDNAALRERSDCDPLREGSRFRGE
jgi:hypothetical protein